MRACHTDIERNELAGGRSVAYDVLLDIIWVVGDKIRCYAKDVLSLNVPPKYLNLCGLLTARCVQVIIT